MSLNSGENYPPDWDSRRKRVYRRDNYTCQNCGEKGGPKGNAELHAHHGVPISKGGTHRLSNLKTYCKECHDAIHGARLAPTTSDTRNKSDTGKRGHTRTKLNRLPFRDCPVCGSKNSLKVHKQHRRLGCPNCKLVLQRHSLDFRRTWEVLGYKNEKIVGCELSEYMWKKFSDEGPVSTTTIKHQVKNLEKNEKISKRTLLFGASSGLFLLLYSFISQSFGLGVLSIILMCSSLFIGLPRKPFKY